MISRLTKSETFYRVLLLLTSLLAATASAYDFKAGSLCYNINSDGTTVTVTHENAARPYYTSITSDVTIPSSVKNGNKTYKVTAIGESAFAYCDLTSISIPNTVTKIENSALYFNYKLTSLSLPASVTTIGDLAFYYCAAIKELTIPAAVKTIGNGAFRNCEGLVTINYNATSANDLNDFLNARPFGGCTALKDFVIGSNVKRIPAGLGCGLPAASVTIPNSVTEIGKAAFYKSSLNTVSIGSGVKTIGEYAFSGCSALTAVTIPNSVTTINAETFYNCAGLKTLTIGTAVTEIDNSAFYGCASLTKVNIPNSVASIGIYAFRNCSKLSSLTLGSGLKTIGQNAFQGCSALTALTIPNSVTTIDGWAFDSCTALASVTIGTAVTDFGSYAFKGCGNLTTVNWNATNCHDTDIPFGNGVTVTTVTIGNNVKRIPANLFSGFSKLTTLSIGTAVTEIAGNAFSYCSSLTKVTIPNSVTTIGRQAFRSCNKMSSLTLGTGLKTMGEYAFSGCSALTAVTIPESVTMVGKNAFANCTGLTTVNWNAANCADFTSSDPLFDGSTNITTFNFGNTVKSIPDYLCYDLTGLKTVTIGTGVTKIGYYCFNTCTGLTRVNISDIAKWCGIDFGVTAYNPRGNPLYHAKNLYLNNVLVTDLTIPSTVTEVKRFAFNNATCLKSVTIPTSVATIGLEAFNSCTGLTRVNISDLEAWCGIDFFSPSSNPVYHAKNLYLNGVKVTDLNIPNTVTSINQYAFNCCEGLTSVTIPPSVETIGQYAFDRCSALTEVTVGTGLKTINNAAFVDCTALAKVNISDLEAWCGIDFYSLRSNPLYYAHHLYLNGEKVTDLEIPSTLETVKNYAFIGCSMASLTISTTVLTIGTNAFNYCDNLTEIVAKGEPAQIKSTTFSNAHYSGAKLHVKEQYAEAYHAATHWKNFTNIIADVVDKVDPEFPDVNHDGLVDVGDANTVLDDILNTGGTTLTFDINGDGVVDVGDVNTILEAILAK